MDVSEIVEAAPLSLKHKLSKLILGTVAGFIAKELVEKAYDKYVIDRKNTSEI